jgi:hypothetical protein
MPVSTGTLLIIAGARVATLVLTLLVLRMARWRRDQALRRHDVPVLVMTHQPGEPTPGRPMPIREVHPLRNSPSIVRRVTSDVPEISISDDEDVEAEVVFVDHDPVVDRPTQPLQAVLEEHGRDRPQMVQGSQLRYYRAEEGTLEFLPGRLEVVGGTDIGQEIHFMRRVGEDETTVTFGRSEGQALRHVQLLDPTVSRQHACLTWSRNHWHLANLSQTNPVSLNGTALPPSGRAVTLQDGDRVEMGAVVFVYRER